MSPTIVTNRLELGAALTALRDQRRLTIRDVVEKSGVLHGTVSGWFAGQHVPTNSSKPAFDDLLAAVGVTSEERRGEWWQAVLRARRSPGRRGSSQSPPYKGLDSFSPEDAEWFFGRDGLVSYALDHLARKPDVPLIIIGASGAGKSSLIRAGIMPALATGRSDLPQHLSPVLLTPGPNPMRALAAARIDASTVLCIDQLEELWTQCRDEAQRRAFLEALTSMPARPRIVLGLRADFFAAAVDEPALLQPLRENTLVVGPLTRDELNAAITAPAARAGYTLEDGLVEVLTSDLAPRDSAQTHDPGALPLLSHALLSTWALSSRKHMTVADYHATGGIKGALQQTAESTYTTLEPAQQELARQIFQRLVNVDGPAETRRRVPLGELLDARDRDMIREVVDLFADQRMLTLTEDAVEITHEILIREWARLRQWIQDNKDSLVVHRRITMAARLWQDSQHDPSTLLGAGRLEVFDQWASSDDHHAELNNLEHEFLAASTTHHEQLRAKEADRQRRLRRLNATLALIAVVAVVAAIAATAAGVYASNQRSDAELARNESMSRQASVQAQRTREDTPALAAQLALAAYRINPTIESRAALLDATATPTPMRLAHAQGATDFALSRDASTLIGTSADGTAHIYRMNGNASAPARTSTLTTGDEDKHHSYAVTLSPDESLAAFGGGSGLVLWQLDGDEPRFLAELDTGGEPIHDAQFAPVGRILVAGTPDGGILRWDLTDPERPVVLPGIVPENPLPQARAAIAHSADGSIMATSTNAGIVSAWDVTIPGEEPALLAELPLGGDGTTVANGLALSPDARFLAAATTAADVQRWDITDLASPTVLDPLTGFDSWVNGVTFTSDGRVLATASSDQTARTWDWATGTELTRFNSPALLTGIAYSTAEDMLITGGDDGIIRIWPTPGPVLGGITGVVFQLRYNADRSILVVTAGRGDRGAHLFDTTDPARPQRLSRIDVPEFSATAAITDDGTILAVGTLDGQVHLWDTSDPTSPRQLSTIKHDHDSLVASLEISRDKQTLITKTYAGPENGVWDISDPASPRALDTLGSRRGRGYLGDFSPDGNLYALGTAGGGVPIWRYTGTGEFEFVADPGDFGGHVEAVRFSPDSTLIAAGGGGGDTAIRLIDVTDPSSPRITATLSGPRVDIYSLDFSADGTRLIGTSGDQIWMWDITDRDDPRVLGVPTAYEGRANDAVFIGDDHHIAAAGWERNVRIWTSAPDSAADWVCDTRGTALTSGEWEQLLPGVPEIDICGTE
ncbi:nSTAND1 domain-containing NTPase [Lolliginicoccus suaedae]|uniref:nSTAND1 domain-containing NTPase n=1 Tax=Lolliginicoccus suaedae TaxID=2605429 RepID=UPI0011EF9B2D|nr:helix-turn-helix domain-containing protein [Lolliginicoccus suaedae]